MKPLNIHIFNNSQISKNDMSGGEKIAMEFSRRWARTNKVFVYTSNLGKNIWEKYQIPKIEYIPVANLGDSENILISYAKRVIICLWRISKIKLKPGVDVIFSASDFWPDVIPALVLKWKNPKIKWVAAFYFFAPKPWEKNNPYGATFLRRIIGIFYWLTQLPVCLILKKFSNLIIACNEVDRKIFIGDGYPEKNIIAIYGGVDLESIAKAPVPKKIIYDAIFVARFHPQKGPLIAVKAWEEVIKTFPHAKLAMIGNGPEEERTMSYIRTKRLLKNVRLFGFVDGLEKYKLIKSSRIFIHPAIYETGGMSAAEGMACGLPVVAFDHEGFKYCYPRGMLTVSPVGDFRNMAKAIMELMIDKSKYTFLKKEAVDLVEKEWDWDKRAFLTIKAINDCR